MKKWILTLCLVLGLVSLSACAEEDYGPVDAVVEEALSAQIQMDFEGYFLTTAAEDTIDQMYNVYLEDDNEIMANAMQAWNQLQGELGEYQEMNAPVVTKSEDGYTVEMTVDYQERKLDVTMLSDKKAQGWTSIALEAEYSFGEKMEKALLNTVMGMGTVFVVLVIIIFVISGFSIINKVQARAQKKKEAAAPAPAPAPVAVPAAEEEPEDDLALIAVITAAIAASENTSPDGLVVRSIRRAGKTNWKRA